MRENCHMASGRALFEECLFSMHKALSSMLSTVGEYLYSVWKFIAVIKSNYCWFNKKKNIQ